MLRYCIIGQTSSRQNIKAVDFLQWKNVFQTEITRPEKVLSLKDGEYDLIHMLLCRKNIEWIKKVRSILGKKSVTKLLLSLDIPSKGWSKEFDNQETLKQLVDLGDIITTTEFKILKDLEAATGKKVYELPHPVDIAYLKSVVKSKNRAKLLESACSFVNTVFRVIIAKLTGKFHDVMFNKDVAKFLWTTEDEVISNLQDADFAIAIEEEEGQGDLCIYAAVLGCLVIGYQTTDAIRRCFNFTTFLQGDYKSAHDFYYWLKTDATLRNFFVENARDKVEDYNWGNMLHRMITLLDTEKVINKVLDRQKFKIQDDRLIVFHKQIYKVKGPEKVDCSRNEFVLICLLKNGAEYIESFMNHYQNLGCKHYFFIDNGSDDDTIALLTKYENVTIFYTDLPHKKYENEVRRTILEYQTNSWCLCVDIDELFEYPLSNCVSMHELLQYLNDNKYTALPAYMLDLFSKDLVFSKDEPSEDISKKYTYYDISQVEKEPYFSENTSAFNFNKLSDSNIRKYYGGIRRTVFSPKDSKFLLLKHPLFFMDGQLEAITTPHYCDKAYIADFTALIKHYKFTPKIKQKVARSVEEGTYTYFAQKEYESYYDVLKDSKTMSLYNPATSKELIETWQLVEEEFLYVSDTFLGYFKESGESLATQEDNVIDKL